MAVKDMKNDELVDHYYELKHLSADDEETANYYKDIIREMASRFAIMTENEAISVKSTGENMLNETAIRIIEEIPIETDEQKVALELAVEALKRYKCIELAPIDDKAFYAFRQDQVLHIYCKTKDDMDNAIVMINKEFGEKNDEVVIKIPKDTLKYSGQDYVVYRKDWIRKHFREEIEIMTGETI